MKNLFKIARKKFINESSWNNWNWDDFEEGDIVSVRRNGPKGDTWINATVIKSNPCGVTFKWNEDRPLICPTKTFRIPKMFLSKSHIKKGNFVEESEKNVPIWSITMMETVNRGNDEESSEDATPEEYTKTYYNVDEAWNDAEKLVDEYKDEEGWFQVDVWEGEYETPEGEIINSEGVYDIFHMLTGTEGYQGHVLFNEGTSNFKPMIDEHSSVTCDGCGREVHDDTVEIVGDKVLCDRCRQTSESNENATIDSWYAAGLDVWVAQYECDYNGEHIMSDRFVGDTKDDAEEKAMDELETKYGIIEYDFVNQDK